MTVPECTSAERTAGLVVGLGASAGGLEALRALLAELPEENGLALVLVQHAERGGGPALVHTVRMATQLPVVEIVDGMPVESGRLHVAPPQQLVELRDGVFHVRTQQGSERPPAPIDHFFYSLSEERGERAVGVVLSGAGTDGTLGLKAISDAGGMTVAQSPATAKFPSMPRNAATTGVADHVLAPDAIPAELLAYADNLPRLARPDAPGGLHESVKSAIPLIAEVLQHETNHDFRHYKTNTLVRRVQRRMQVLHLDDVGDYLAHVQQSRAEAEALFRELLIGVTAFFRDPSAFDSLAEQAIPKVFESRLDHQIRIWVPGCATGEEAYSIAILVREEMERRAAAVDVQIFATDIDERALQIARAGVYPAGIAEDVPPARLARFFVRRGDRYHVTKEIRELCLFTPHNLIGDPPFSRQDLISCRNVLIYLGTHLQNKLVPLFHYALRPGGFLFLGPSESITSHTELFRPIDAKHRISQRKPSGARPTAALERTSSRTRDSQATVPDGELARDLPQILQRILLDEFTPKGVVVNGDGGIVCASGDMSRYLSVSGGNFQNNVIKMARRGLRVGLRATLAEAAKLRRRVVHDSLSVRTDEGVQPVVLTVQPMPQLGESSELYMVVFEDAGPTVGREVSRAAGGTDDADALVGQLEAELESTRDDLERSIQDLEATNEELKSSNEELLSMNEELQSANEELETSKEEVQSAHEALAQAHTDLENLLRSTEIAVVFLDDELCLRGFTPSACAIYNLIDSDVGRPLWHLTHRALEMPDLPAPDEIDAAGGVVEDTVRTTEGQWYTRRVRRYRTSEGAANGILVTFDDVTRLQSSEQRFRLMADAAPVLIWMAGLDNDCTWFNAGWLDFTGRTLEEERGDRLARNVHPDDFERCARTYEEACEARRPFQMEYRLRRHDGAYRWILDHGVPLHTGSEFAGYIGTCVDIDERRRAEETRATLAAVVQSSSDAIVSKTLDGVIRSWNPAAEQLFGYTAEEAIGQNIRLVIPADRQAEEDMIVDKLRRGESIDHYETIRVAKGGALVDVSLSIAAVRDATGAIVGAAKVAREIGARKRMESELRLQRELLQRSADAMPAAIAYVDAEARYVFVNRHYHEQFEKPIDQILGHTIREVMGEENYARLAPHVEKALRGEEQEYEVDLHFPGGIQRRAVTYVPHAQPDGSIAGFHSMSLDITERDRTARALVEQARLLDASHDAILVWEVGGGIEYWNQGAVGLYDYSCEEALGRRPLELLRAVLPVPWDEIDRAICDAGEWEGRVVHRRKDGAEVAVLTRYQFVGRPRGPVILETNRDVTEQVRAEKALRAATEAAQAANQSKSEFLANTSHEIRTPMTAILGYADLLARHMTDPDDLQCVRTIRRNGEFLLEIVNDILDLSRIEAGRLDIVRERFAVDELVHEVVSLMHVRAAEKGLPLAVEYDGLVPETIESDPTRLRQILVNLIGNAIKFTDSGEVRLGVRAEPEHDRLVFDVADTGIGMSADQQRRLFLPFSQVDTSVTREFGGSGLGLAISRRLADMLGGEISLASAPGRGSTFTLSIAIGRSQDVPLVEPRAALVRAPRTEAPSRRLDCRVLVVDDRRDIRLLTQHVLEEAGAHVEVAVDGRDALDRMDELRESGRTPDVVLLDIQMPNLDGYEVARLLREQGYERPLIALTAHAMKGDHERCREAGCDDYIAKPIDAPELVETVARHAPAQAAASQPTKRVLIVDDSRDTCRMMELLLQARGYEVATALDGRTAIELAREFRPQVVLLDLTLPDIDGREVARALRKASATRHSVLIALTGHSDDGDGESTRAAGFDHHVLKPANIDELERRFVRQPTS